MKKTTLSTLTLAVSCSLGLGLLSGCSSSSNDTSSISGVIMAAPINGADVRVMDGSGNLVAGPVTTNAAGEYSVNIPNSSLAQDLIIKSAGGSFTDEATGNTGIGGEMLAYALADSLTDGGSVSTTPGSTIIANLIIQHSFTMTQAQDGFAAAFGYTPDISVVPSDSTSAPTDGESADSTLAGFRAATFSQLAMDLGLSHNTQFTMFADLADDLSDGSLNGAIESVNIATLNENIRNRFSNALINFQNNGYNESNLDNSQIGTVPFSKIALTDTYQIEYMQMGDMGAMNGKSTFQIHVTNRESGADVTELAPMLMPMMNMATMTHSSPKPTMSVTEDSHGLYNVTLYYLMPSIMMDGSSMGYWDLKFTFENPSQEQEVAHLYPTVMMSMGDTLQTRLKGVDDKIMNMEGGMEGRTYFLFKDALTAGTGMNQYNFSLFIATKKDMMTFPAITDGTVLSDAMTIDIANTEVRVSANNGAWSTPLTTANGIWTINDLDLNLGENQIRVKLTVNNEVKTTDGLVGDADINDYQTFTITTGMSM